MAKLYNMAWMTTLSTGTGTVTLAAAMAGYLSFANAGVVDGDVVTYVIVEGNNREMGIGTYTASGTTLSRDTVLASTAGGTTKITLAGNATVFIDASAQDIQNTFKAQALRGDAVTNTIGLSMLSPPTGTHVMTANRLYLMPLYVPLRRNFTRIWLRVTAAVAATNIRLGLYNADQGTAHATTLLADGGNISSATTGLKAATINVTPEPGWVCLAVASDGAPTVRSGNNEGASWGTDATFEYSVQGDRRTFTFGALPADESAQTYADWLPSGNTPYMVLA